MDLKECEFWEWAFRQYITVNPPVDSGATLLAHNAAAFADESLEAWRKQYEFNRINSAKPFIADAGFFKSLDEAHERRRLEDVNAERERCLKIVYGLREVHMLPEIAACTPTAIWAKAVKETTLWIACRIKEGK